MKKYKTLTAVLILVMWIITRIISTAKKTQQKTNKCYRIIIIGVSNNMVGSHSSITLWSLSVSSIIWLASSKCSPPIPDSVRYMRFVPCIFKVPQDGRDVRAYANNSCSCSTFAVPCGNFRWAVLDP